MQGEPNAVADAALLARCREVEQRAAQTLKVASEQNWLLDIALDHLTLGRAALYRAVLNVPAGAGPGEPETGVASDSKPGEAETALASDSKPGGCNPWALRGSPGRPGAGPEKAEALQTARRELAAAVDGLRRAGTTHHLPLGLLSRAWLRGLEGDGAGARADLDEAGQIAQRGAMRLHMADVHLYRARLFRAGPDRAAALADVAEARKLIEQHGYRRRDPELADVEAALGVADP